MQLPQWGAALDASRHYVRLWPLSKAIGAGFTQEHLTD